MTNSGEPFKVGAWLIEPSLNQLSSGGHSVRVEPQVMEVLVCLAENAGSPVSKDFFMSTVWAGTIVTGDSLSRCISILRKVFRDDARSPRFIETISRHGYRLVAEVIYVSESNNVVPRIIKFLVLSAAAAALLFFSCKAEAQTCYSITGDNATILFLQNSVRMDQVLAVLGDSIRVYTPSGVCAGAAEVKGMNYALTAWADNPFTPEVDGFLTGDPFRFEIKDVSTGLVYLEASLTLDPCTGCLLVPEYFSGVIYLVSSLTSTIALSIGGSDISDISDAAVYPNPFRDYLSIEGQGEVVLYDLVGREIWRRVHVSRETYRHYTGGLSAGVYLVRINSRPFPVVKL